VAIADVRRGASSLFGFHDLLEAIPTAVYTTDSDGYVTAYNQAAVDLVGRTPQLGRDRWCITWKLLGPDGGIIPPNECAMAVALQSGESLRNFEVTLVRPDGGRSVIMPFPTPLKNAVGDVIGAINMLVEVGALKEAEADAARRADEQAALYRFTDRLYRAEGPADVYEAGLDAILGALHCHRASLLMFDEGGVMQFVAARGLSAAYREAVTGHTPWKPGEAQPEPITISDVAKSDLSDELKDVILAEGLGAIGFFPIVAHGGVVGKFMAYFDRPHVFIQEEVSRALVLARQLGFHVERTRAAEALRESEERFRAIVETTPECVKLVAADGRLLHMNNSGLDMVEAACLEDVAGKSVYDLIAPEDREAFIDLNRRVCAGERASLKFDIIGINGARKHMETHATPFRHSDGSMVQLAVTRDISAHHEAEQDRQRFISIIENSEDAIISKDLNGFIVSWNAGAQRVFGYTADEIIGKHITTLMPPQLAAEEPTILDRIRRGERVRHYETVRRRKDGAEIDISLTVSPVKDERGRIIGASKIARDITERKRSDAQRTLLINELNHRVKNTLATVQSLAMQTLRNTERSDQARALLDARLTALSRAHDVLTTENWEGADLREVVVRALEAFRASSTRVEVKGPSVRLTPKQALALSLALHELATNAAKYGALSGDHGKVNIKWVIESDGDRQRLTLTWTESGGPPVTPPPRQGFGSRLIERSLAYELDGEASITYHPTGVVSVISSPLESQTAPEGSW
jgi:PAS domain S-box-containing protein